MHCVFASLYIYDVQRSAFGCFKCDMIDFAVVLVGTAHAKTIYVDRSVFVRLCVRFAAGNIANIRV